MQFKLQLALLILLSIALVFIIVRTFFKMESFSQWDDFMTTKITGRKWVYDTPTTRIEYDFKKVDPHTKKETRIAPVTWNSFPEGTPCKFSEMNTEYAEFQSEEEMS